MIRQFELLISIERQPPCGSALAAPDLRCSPQKGLAIPFGPRLAQAQQEHSASAIPTLTEY